jgi:hypothetical protein
LCSLNHFTIPLVKIDPPHGRDSKTCHNAYPEDPIKKPQRR